MNNNQQKKIKTKNSCKKKKSKNKHISSKLSHPIDFNTYNERLSNEKTINALVS